MMSTQCFSPSSSLEMLYFFISIINDLAECNIKSVVSNIKWAWSFLIHQCFFHHQLHGVSQNLEGLGSSHARFEPTSTEQVECAICLSVIGEDEEIKELRCRHLFHEACLDQWLRLRNRTCPLCRDNLVLPRVVSEFGHELQVFDFGSLDNTRNEGLWWLR